GVAPETCATQGPSSSPLATSAIEPSGTQRRTSWLLPPTATPRSRRRAETAGTDDFDALEHSKLQFRSGYRALEAYTGDATLACFVGRRFLLGLAVALACIAPGQAR